MATVHCDKHGDQDETFVCQHIVQGLSEGVSYGFWWANNPGDPRPNAWCSMCNDLVANTNGEWTDEILEVAKVSLLCGACYDQAKDMNVAGE